MFHAFQKHRNLVQIKQFNLYIERKVCTYINAEVIVHVGTKNNTSICTQPSPKKRL